LSISSLRVVGQVVARMAAAVAQVDSVLAQDYP
jgi:hypothetical protein